MRSLRFPRFLALCTLPLCLLGADPAAPTAASGPSVDAMRSVMNSFEIHGEVALENPGDLPRQVLAFSPRAGATATVVQTQTMNMTMSMNGQSPPMPATSTVTTTRSAVRGPDGQGNMRVRSEIISVEQSGAVAEAAAAFGAMKGLATEMVVNPAGKVVGVEVTNAADPAMAQLVEQIAKGAMQNLAQFPVQPVGVGGRWRLEYDIGVAGMSMLAETTNTLRSRTGDAVVIDVETSIQRGDSAFQFPGLPPDAHLELGSLVGNATGTMTIDLGTLASTGTQKMTMDLQMTMSMAKSSMPPMVMTMHMEQDLSSQQTE